MLGDRKLSISSVRSDVSWIKGPAKAADTLSTEKSTENGHNNIEFTPKPVSFGVKQANQYSEGQSTAKAVMKVVGPPKCHRCTLSVYKVEEVNAINKIYHKTCFKCGGNASDGCQKKLTLGHYLVHDDDPYCEPCYAKLFRPKGYGFGGTLSLEYDTKVDPRDKLVSHAVPISPVYSSAEIQRNMAKAKATFSVPPMITPSSAASSSSSSSASPSSQSGKVKNFVLGGALAPKCCSCNKTVYKVEEVTALGMIWHKTCFVCGGTSSSSSSSSSSSDKGCGRCLTLDKYLDHAGQPYCHACYSKQFKPKGFGFAANLQTGMSMADTENG